MKKIILSVAIFAISLSGFASTGEAKITKKILEDPESTCNDVYNSAYIYARNAGANETQAVSIAGAARKECYKGMSTPEKKQDFISK